MTVTQAKKLKKGDWVAFPPDRGGVGGKGKVLGVTDTVHKNHQGIEFVWVDLGQSGMWPSNRL